MAAASMHARVLAFPLAAAGLALAVVALEPSGLAAPAALTQTGTGAVIAGRVEIGVPITTRRALSPYPSRAVSPEGLAPPSELRHVVVYLRDAPPQQGLQPMTAEMRQQGE